MAFDEVLAGRIREQLVEQSGISERKMFGGIAFMLDDKMFAGVIKDDLMVRVDPQTFATALTEPHVREMDFSGRPMQGYLYVAPAGLATDEALARWLDLARSWVATLPAKPPKKPTKP
jgi:TfoX/Sxy family transcriptional regulator of competence genes